MPLIMLGPEILTYIVLQNSCGLDSYIKCSKQEMENILQFFIPPQSVSFFVTTYLLL